MAPAPDTVYYVVTKNGEPLILPQMGGDTEIESFLQALGYTLVQRCETHSEAHQLQQDIVSGNFPRQIHTSYRTL